MATPLLSVVVIFYNMRREASRTLLSLSTAYQTGVTAEEYEVIAIDNGSRQPLDPALVEEMGPQFQYHFHKTTSVSPVDALNLGVQMSKGRYIAVIVDGARMTTPGLLRETLDAVQTSENPFLCSLTWHLGPNFQKKSMLEGYDQSVEDKLLASIAWPSDGYRLFDISTLAPSSRRYFITGFPSECSWVCLPRSMFDQLEGYDPNFKSLGGGLVNHDFVKRAAARSNVTFIVLLGEGVFHQFHGGVATNALPDKRPADAFKEEYKTIRGTDYDSPRIENAVLVGEIPASANIQPSGSLKLSTGPRHSG